MTRKWAALPLGELHQEGVCAFCGFRSEYPTLVRVVVQSTHAVGVRCADHMACIRRRRKARG